MSLEGQLLDRKSLRAVAGKSADWAELAKDCVAFANALGGRLLIGIENGEDSPPHDQRIPADLQTCCVVGLTSSRPTSPYSPRSSLPEMAANSLN